MTGELEARLPDRLPGALGPGTRSHEEPEQVAVGFRLSDEVALHLDRRADELAELGDGLRVVRNALAAQLLQPLVAEHDAPREHGGREHTELGLLCVRARRGACER